RQAERDLLKGRINGHRVYAFNSNRTFLTKTFKSIRGEVLSNLIKEHLPNISIGMNDKGSNIIETFPTGIVSGLFPDIYPVKYKRKKGMTFEETVGQMKLLTERIGLLEQRGIISGFKEKLMVDEAAINREHHKHLEDKLDAVLCTLGHYLIYKEMAAARKVGTDKDGFILLPEALEEIYITIVVCFTISYNISKKNIQGVKWFMKAVVYYDTKDVRIEEVAEPKVYAEG